MTERLDTDPASAEAAGLGEWPEGAPTAEQCERFRRLTPEQRFYWLTDLLQLMHDLATPETRAAWRRNKQRR